ncbi:unnamed protein product [Thlaspi arvense]|uniref:CCHC-type domain-containing protein n=1 Tax=Thlaspi arvense TaxID=13288 RepID=A0AAU9T661_THLAR|nr:unnamed protein product [Thlaspi arvense]
MEAEDVLDLPALGNSGLEVQKNGLESGNRSPEANHLVGIEENVIRNLDTERDLDIMEESLRAVTEQVSDVFNASVESVSVDEKVCIQKETIVHCATLDVSYSMSVIMDVFLFFLYSIMTAKSGVKRPRTTCDEQQPTVHVTYQHLTRASKQKLESLLQQWSEWEAEYTSVAQDQKQPLESGEETFFPALRVGLQKTSSVSFWIDNQTGPKPLEEFVLVESSTTPLYDRKFSLGQNSADGSNNLEGGLEIIDDPPRCFNCGGYSHSLRECPKPFDRSAVNSARKLQKSKRNQNSGSRLPSRYYQKLQTGKYDGLKPGTLDAETRQLLNLGELDPPPWLNRMREIGYPPGYLAPEDDHLSGITIFGEEEEEESREELESEDGEILEKGTPPEPQMKMTVEFPGINAPLPENADDWLWEAAPSYRSSRSNNRSWHQKRTSRGHDYRDDDQLGFESSSYPPRYGSRINYGYGSKDYRSRSRSPGIERSKKDYSYDPDFRDRDRGRNRDRNRDWDRDRDIDRDRDRDRDWERDRDLDRDWDRDDRDWSNRLSSRR